MDNKRKKIWGIVAFAIFILFWLLFAWFVGKPMLQFIGQPEEFRTLMDNHFFLSRLMFVLMVAVQVIIAIIPGEPLEICAGYAFGLWEGLLLCTIGIIIGSAVVIVFTRKWGMKVVEIFFSQEKIMSLRFLKDHKRFHALTFILFLIPGTPKDILTYFVGLTTMPISTFLWIAGLARIPSVVTSTMGGNALGSEKYLFAVIVFLATSAVSCAGIVLYNKITARHNRHLQEKEQSKNSSDDIY